MRKSPTHDIEQYRIVTGSMASTKVDGANGAFIIPMSGGVRLRVVCSDGSGWSESGLPGDPWEHVSVSCADRCPTWLEMDYVKRIFWKDDELVLQYHMPRAEHINIHDFVLHLWRPVGVTIPRPPKECV